MTEDGTAYLSPTPAGHNPLLSEDFVTINGALFPFTLPTDPLSIVEVWEPVRPPMIQDDDSTTLLQEVMNTCYLTFDSSLDLTSWNIPATISVSTTSTIPDTIPLMDAMIALDAVPVTTTSTHAVMPVTIPLMDVQDVVHVTTPFALPETLPLMNTMDVVPISTPLAMPETIPLMDALDVVHVTTPFSLPPLMNTMDVVPISTPLVMSETLPLMDALDAVAVNSPPSTDATIPETLMDATPMHTLSPISSHPSQPIHPDIHPSRGT
jgi:hypothetical protein